MPKLEFLKDSDMNINSNDILEIIKSRRSTRSFLSDMPCEQDITKILEAATYAPSGMNYQTWHFTAVLNGDKLAELNRLIRGAFAKSEDQHLKERGNNAAYCCYYHAPVLIIVSNDPKQWWASMDCACAIENMFLAATSMGIGSCWINQLGTTCHDEEVRAFITELGVPQDHTVYGCVALGYPNPDVNLKEKKIRENSITIVR